MSPETVRGTTQGLADVEAFVAELGQRGGRPSPETAGLFDPLREIYVAGAFLVLMKER